MVKYFGAVKNTGSGKKIRQWNVKKLMDLGKKITTWGSYSHADIHAQENIPQKYYSLLDGDVMGEICFPFYSNW